MAFKRKAKALTKKNLPKLVRQIQIRQAEHKTYSFTVAAAVSVGTGWTLNSLIAGAAASTLGIKQGIDYNQRIGDRIRLHAIHYTVYIVPASVMPDGNGSFCRVIVYHNNQAGGLLPTGTDLFVADTANELRNPLLRNRLTILKDFTHQMVVTGTNAASNLTSGPEFFGTFSMYPKTEITYVGATDGEIDTVSKHDYGIGFCSTTAACCNVSIKTQVVYTDI